MDEIFSNAKNILVVWLDHLKPEMLLEFEKTLQIKAKQAKIILEDVRKLFESQRPTSSFDLILFDIVNETDSPTNTEYLNEFFRLLRPKGHLIIHIQQVRQNQAIDHFKMCGFTSCNPLDANSSFLIENKDDEVKRSGSLWLCQKPSFDVGYSVPLRRTGVNLIRQISSTGGKKIWTVENEEDDEEDEEEMVDNNQFFEDKNCNTGKSASEMYKERAIGQENLKKSSENFPLGDSSKSVPHMSDV